MVTENIHKIEVLIIDHDLFFSKLLSKRLGNIQLPKNISGQYFISITQLELKDISIRHERESKKSLDKTIVFVDYEFLNLSNKKDDLLMKIDELYRNVFFVLMTADDSESVIFNPNLIKSNQITKISKNKYTPDLCAVIIENYLKSL